MTNQEVYQFFVDNGAYCDLEIVDKPVFQHHYIHDSGKDGLQVFVETCFVKPELVDNMQNFISKYLNDKKKWYIYNDTTTVFCMNMNYIRIKGVELDDYVKLQKRSEKLEKIIKKINDKPRSTSILC